MSLSGTKEEKTRNPLRCKGRLLWGSYWFPPLLLVLFLLLFRLSDVAGLHRDEATFALFAEEILQGLRPVRGVFNYYTAPLHSYIIALCFSLFGKGIWSLRISGVIFNILALAAYVDIVRRVNPEKALWTMWFLVTFPMFVVFSRISGENYALNPFFLFVGIWAFYVLGLKRSGRISKMGYVLSGLLFFLGVWNHLIFLPSVVGVAIVYILAVRPSRSEVNAVFPWFALGWILGVLPKLYGCVFLGYPFIPPHAALGQAPLWSAVLNVLYTLGGEALYARACGEVLLPLNWILPLALGLMLVFFFIRTRDPRRRKMVLAVFSCLVINVLGNWYIVPPGMIGARFWLLPLWFVPLLLAFCLPESPKWWRVILGSFIIACNLLGVGVNYFYNFLQDGGIPRIVYTGGRHDNSWGFMDLRPVVKKLEKDSSAPIYLDGPNNHRLAFLLPEKDRRRARTLPSLCDKNYVFPKDSLILFYRKEGETPREWNQIWRSRAEYQRELSTPYIDVYQVVEP